LENISLFLSMEYTVERFRMQIKKIKFII